MNGVDEVTQLRARLDGAAATVELPAGWRVVSEDDTDAVALPVDLARFEGDGFVPTILVRLVDEAPYAVPADAGKVLIDTGDIDTGEIGVDGPTTKRVAVAQGLVGPGQPLLQMIVSNRVGPYQALVVATATSAQWPVVADAFDSLAGSASLRVGALEADS